MDNTKTETPTEKMYVYLCLAQAFLTNGEPKSSQVCLTECNKLRPDASCSEAEFRDIDSKI